MAVAAALGAVLLSSCSSEPEGEGGNWRGSRGDAAVRVIVERVRFEEDTQRVQSVGTARARLSADIFPESAGEVVAVSFSPGQLVQENDVLVRLESRAERLAVARAGVAVRDAEQLLDRYDRIDVEGAISDSQIDVARTALEATRIDLDLARNALEERVVRAPFTGFVGLTDIDPGARVTTQTMITRLDDRSSLFVDFSAPEQVFSGLSIGDEIRMEPFAQPGQSVTARIEAIDTGIDPATRNFTVRALVDNEEDRLRPGMSFRVEFELPGQSFPTLPEASILWGGEGAYVWSVDDNKAVRTPIDIVARNQGRVLVRGALDPQSVVVVEGVQKVRVGSDLQYELDGADVALTGERGGASGAAGAVGGGAAR